MRASRTRRGFTLVELLIVVVLLGLVGGGIMRVIVGQQRFYRGATDIIDTRSQLRQAASVLPSDLRGLSSVAGDITAFSTSSVEFRANSGSSVLCEKTSGGAVATQIAIPPTTLASGQTLTSWLERPVAGDTLFVFDDGADIGAADDGWSTQRVVSVDSTLTRCLPAGTMPLTTAADASRYRYLLTIAPGVSATTQLNAPIRFSRRVRYNLYQATDGQWYLGYDYYRLGAWAGVQPVSGPYVAGAAATPAAQRGMEMHFYTEAGAEVTTAAAASTIARVDVVFRAQSRRAVQLSGVSADTYRDSVAISVAIRNRR